jgi:hypothetical protein
MHALTNGVFYLIHDIHPLVQLCAQIGMYLAGGEIRYFGDST